MKKAKYYIYWNLHKRCFSVKYRGKVIYHLFSGSALGVTFKVSQAGRRRVLREGKKNVHAFIVADEIHFSVENTAYGPRVTYNPYNSDTFVEMQDGKAISAHKYLTFFVVNGRPLLNAEGLQFTPEQLLLNFENQE